MGYTLRLDPSQCCEVRDYILRGRNEEAAFLFVQENGTNELSEFVVAEIYLVPSADLALHTSYNIALTDEALAALVKSAWEKGNALAEVHSHRAAWRAQFSPSDLFGLRDFAPHVVWRLKRPYLAFVVTENDYDALVWTSMGLTPTNA